MSLVCRWCKKHIMPYWALFANMFVAAVLGGIVAGMILLLCGCASARKYVLDEKTGEMVLVEKYVTTGQKVEAKFKTGGEIKTDTGIKVPEFQKIELSND